MELKLTKEQEELLLKNYENSMSRAAKLNVYEKALMKCFLLECIGEMLSEEVKYRLYDEMITDTLKATMEFMLK